MRETFRAYAQSRGTFWPDAFDLSDCSFKDKISGFNVVFGATYTKTASIEERALLSNVTTAAYGAGTRFAVSSAAHLAYPGTTLDGGLTRDMGLVSIQNHLKYPLEPKSLWGPCLGVVLSVRQVSTVSMTTKSSQPFWQPHRLNP